VSHPADDAVIVWGRLGVPEIWRFDPIAEEFGFRLRRKNGTYARRERGKVFPMLTSVDILQQMKLADQRGAGTWHSQLRAWVHQEILPRRGGGG
jgi:hypothetical protein